MEDFDDLLLLFTGREGRWLSKGQKLDGIDDSIVAHRICSLRNASAAQIECNWPRTTNTLSVGAKLDCSTSLEERIWSGVLDTQRENKQFNVYLGYVIGYFLKNYRGLILHTCK